MASMMITIMIFAQQKNNRFISAGFSNDSDFIRFYCHFQEAVVKNDTNWISNILLYPLTVYDSTHAKIIIKNSEQFFHSYKRVFSKSLVDCIISNDVGHDSPWTGPKNLRSIWTAFGNC
jgi:hypothetical protein